MKPTNDDISQRLDRLLARHKTPSPDRMQAATRRVAERLRADVEDLPTVPDESNASRGVRWIPAVAAAAVLAAAIGTAILWPRGDMYVTTDAAQLITLDDGSRVEMRAQSELTVEATDDGLRIRLDRGGIIVDAAEQRGGHLWVQTKDMTVSVVGTVFLVNADKDGSRVAVIEGEVHVQQGAVETTLMRGDHLATNASVKVPPVSEAIAWSRNAPALVALLQQSAVVPPANIVAQASPVVREAFEEISIRPAAASATGGRGGGAARPFVVRYGNALGCSQGAAQIDPGRFAYYGVTVYTLIVHAYGNTKAFDLGGCVDASRVAPIGGGADWIRSDQWDIQATFAPGSPTDLESVRRRIRTLLAERFKLEIRRGTREVPAYALIVAGNPSRFAATPGAATRLTERELPTFLPPDYKGVGNNIGDGSPYLFFGRNASIADIASVVVRLGGRPVLDRTGLSGQFDFAVPYPIVAGPDGEAGGLMVPLNDGTWSSFRSEFQRQLGFRLEEAQTTVDAQVIERAEKPSEN